MLNHATTEKQSTVREPNSADLAERLQDLQRRGLENEANLLEDANADIIEHWSGL